MSDVPLNIDIRLLDAPDPPPSKETLALIEDADTPTAEEAAESEIDRQISARAAEQFKRMGGWTNQQVVLDKSTGDYVSVDPRHPARLLPDGSLEYLNK